jgi:hypothetical protein
LLEFQQPLISKMHSLAASRAHTRILSNPPLHKQAPGPTACTLPCRFAGNHNSQRPQVFYDAAAAFIAEALITCLASDAPDAASQQQAPIHQHQVLPLLGAVHAAAVLAH